MASDCPGSTAGDDTCINGVCHSACTLDTDCANPNDMCDHGICRPDWRPQPQCRGNAECAEGLACVNAVCRQACWYPEDCASGLCHSGFCAFPEEIAVECRDSRECSAPTGVCSNATCVAP